ncbi:26S PROTEASOME SUBUNIT ALPHA-4 [Encephalitozoon cuniculi GB-M1]|uniref:26S PROTEASOME SUBUNIT ALPHA-4 n=2 Tax=Encephalitozoon cuniculi TaxID=6035 RepID=Q8SRJ0_ENCCU|nr:proteasome core particle subunit alpha 4 [Encephalitozoon cuniculi GB-M1]AGE95852.1 26S proteasome subunit alpha-4 [Encephalitozoon cuniculi]KMV65829.1 proteasome subunit alpha [Encephalitozoon cuniculi EcunIII-L]UYI27267.1 Proteasome subunit alpha type-7-B [Encephalitozoon cuniculi]CAD25637.1 26S PROTEASOME SUBUNIT ALPHA-4 [Encephalitozoon cuniculi GB-M1]
MGFEEQLAVFSPDGRLIQVEYAQQASEQGSLVVFGVDSEKISVSIERKSGNRLLLEEEKLFPISESQKIWMSYSGFKPDAYLVMNVARMICFSYKNSTGEDIAIDQLARMLSEYKQRYTVVYHQRPFGVRTVLFGLEPRPVAYVLEPDGNFSEFFCGAIGQKSQKVCEYLEKGEKGDLVRLTILGLMEVVQSDPNKMSSFVLSRRGFERVEGSTIMDVISSVSQ